MTNQYPKFGVVNHYLLENIHSILFDWFPNGKIQGKQFIVGSIRGEAGRSFSVCLQRGIARDFSENIGYGDLISVYAAKYGFTQTRAATNLAEKYNLRTAFSNNIDNTSLSSKPKMADIVKPPMELIEPNSFYNWALKKQASNIFCYKDEVGYPQFYIAKYLTLAGKTFLPFCYSKLKDSWIIKGWPGLQPLYGLEKLRYANPESIVVITEGEACADAAQKMLGDDGFSVSWPFGAGSINNVDWSPLYKRRILLWPDNDSVGLKAMNGISSKLRKYCPDLKIWCDPRFFGHG